MEALATLQRDEFDDVLAAAQGGDTDAEAQLFESIQDEIRRLASAIIRSHNADVQATSLANDAYVKLMSKVKRADGFSLKNRAYFFTAFAGCMRCLLIDRLRRPTHRQWNDTLDEFLADFQRTTSWDFTRIHRIMERFLRSENPKVRRRHQLINLHFFCGMKYKDAAEQLGISTSQYQIDKNRALSELQLAYEEDE